jgi:circadian clock protein KaiB
MNNIEGEPEVWELRLYIAGQTPRAMRAIDNLQRISEEHLAGKYKIEVIDISKNPQVAKNEQIVATPAVIRKLPIPLRQIIGDLTDTEKVLMGLRISPIKK